MNIIESPRNNRDKQEQELIEALANFQASAVLLLEEMFPEDIESTRHLEEYVEKVPDILDREDRLAYIFDSGLAGDLYPNGMYNRPREEEYCLLGHSTFVGMGRKFDTRINKMFLAGASVADLYPGYGYNVSKMRINYIWGICRENRIVEEARDREKDVSEDSLEFPGESFRDGLKREFIDKISSLYFDDNLAYIAKINFILNLYRDQSDQLEEGELLRARMAREGGGGEEMFYINRVTIEVQDALSRFFDDFFSVEDLPKVLGA
jgi:hypothetical protein